MIGNIGPMEVILVLVIGLLILGPKKLPEVGRSVGRGMREFKDGISGAVPEDEPQLVEAHRASDSAPSTDAPRQAQL